MKSKNACGSRERERERESRNLRKIEEREGLYSKNRPLFICTTKLTQGKVINDNAGNILKMQISIKNNSKKSILNAVSGITLIALVVTIVVLLILASVSITVVFGDNGILELAKEAGEKTNQASEDDQRQIARMNALLHKETWIYTTEDEKNIPIPAGFAPTQISGENRVDGGLVITDEKGNEFVWIAVPKNDEIYKLTTVNATNFDDNFYTNIENDLKKYVKDYRDERGDFSDECLEDCQLDRDEYITLKNSMLKSIYVNGGFWIGRYEVGYEGEVRYKENNNWSEEVDKNPVIKEGAYPLNYISYVQAQKLSNSMIYGEYEGSLMFGIQWDLVCKFIEVNNGKTKDEIKNDSMSWGNCRNSIFNIAKGKYSVNDGETFTEVIGSYEKGAYEAGKGVLLTTGATKRNSALNIYDLVGNLNEFSLEMRLSTLVGGVISLNLRGGDYQKAGDKCFAHKGDISYGASYGNVGFRVTLIPCDR